MATETQAVALTEAELAAIEAREKAASTGPWIPKHIKTIYTNGESEHEVRSKANGMTVAAIRFRPQSDELGGDVQDRDCTFIAAARSDVPRLVADNRRMRALLKSIQWDGDGDGCPCCGRDKFEGHGDACELAEAGR